MPIDPNRRPRCAAGRAEARRAPFTPARKLFSNGTEAVREGQIQPFSGTKVVNALALKEIAGICS